MKRIKGIKRIIFLLILLIAFTGSDIMAQRVNTRGNKKTEKREGKKDKKRTNSRKTTRTVNRERTRTVTRETTVKSYPKKSINYKKKHPKRRIVRHLPNKKVVIHHHGRKYHCHEGRYYRYVGGRFVLDIPPVGIHINFLPVGHVRIRVGSGYVYFSNGVYYRPRGKEYVIIDPPMGAIVPDLPYDAERVIIGDRVFWEFNGIIYKRIRDRYGRAYKVVGKIDF